MDRIARAKVKDLLKSEPSKDVLAKGWVRTKRGNKNVAFIALNDGSTINNIQIVCDVASFDENRFASSSSVIAPLTSSSSTYRIDEADGFFT